MKIELKLGDLTRENVCAIVNAANSSLLGGGGVDGAIHAAGGPQVLRECKQIRKTLYPDGLPAGEAVETSAGNMPARYVIHTVGPIYSQCGPRCEELLCNAYTNSIKTALALGCRSISFPAISTGVYGYPEKEAAKIAYKAVRSFEEDIEVFFIFHSQKSMDTFKEAVAEDI